MKNSISSGGSIPEGYKCVWGGRLKVDVWSARSAALSHVHSCNVKLLCAAHRAVLHQPSAWYARLWAEGNGGSVINHAAVWRRVGGGSADAACGRSRFVWPQGTKHFIFLLRNPYSHKHIKVSLSRSVTWHEIRWHRDLDTPGCTFLCCNCRSYICRSY